MTLKEIINNLHSYDEDETIFVTEKLQITGDIEAGVYLIPEDDSAPSGSAGKRCFIDIWHALEIIEGKSRVSGISNPNLDQKVEFLVSYSQQGA